MLREMVRYWVKEYVEPQAFEYDKEEKFNLELLKSMGEMGLLGNAHRNATISAADDTKLLELTKLDLEELSEDYPGLFKELELSVSNRTSD